MESDVLARILQAEREIEAKIDVTRKRCRDHLQRLREEAKKRIAQEEILIREQCMRTLEEAEELARKKTAEFLKTEAERAERLGNLTDEALKKVVMKHLIRILPGEKHDRSHVQG